MKILLDLTHEQAELLSETLIAVSYEGYLGEGPLGEGWQDEALRSLAMAIKSAVDDVILKKDEFSQIEADARRYRWLRAQCDSMPPWSELDDAWDSPENLDKAIDHEINREENQ